MDYHCILDALGWCAGYDLVVAGVIAACILGGISIGATGVLAWQSLTNGRDVRSE